MGTAPHTPTRRQVALDGVRRVCVPSSRMRVFIAGPPFSSRFPRKRPSSASIAEDRHNLLPVPVELTMAKPAEVIVHPLVLLSTVDHYNRVAKDTRKRVVGVLLGESYRGRVDVTNSFAGAHALPARAHMCLCVRLHWTGLR